jgi:hypothetical protein
MSFATLQKAVTYLLAGVGLVALSFGGEISTLSLAVIAVAYVASWFVEGEIIEQPWWGRGWNIFLLVAMGIQIARALIGGEGWLGYAMEFAALLTLSRLFTRRTAADYQQVAMLAFMHLIAATVLTSDLGYAGVFLAFVVVTPWSLTLAHMRFEIERNYPKERDAQGGSDVKRVLASKRLVGPMFLLWTALLSLPMLAMTIGLFLIFPRVGLGFVTLGQQRGQHVAGFGNRIELGGFGVIRDDPTVVVRVTPPRPLTLDERHKFLRLRGTAFDHYDGRKWTRSDGMSLRMSPMGDYYSIRREDKRSDLTFQVVLDRLDEPVLFLAPGTVGVRIPKRGVMGTTRERARLTRSHGLDLRYESSDELGIVYELVVSKQASDLDVPVTRDMDEDRYLQVPPKHEHVAALAKRITQGLDNPIAIANRLLIYLRDEDRYQYTLVQPDVGDRNPLDVFLFEAKRGHCEYFATALAVMLRASGIPARNVTGFVGGEYNKYGGYYAVRQADAHSWVEAYIPERGWVTLDPTPASRDDFGPASWLLRDFNEMLDAMRAYWMLRVVGYDLRTQVHGLRQISAFFRSLSWPNLSFFKKSGHTEQRVGPTEHAQPGNGSLATAFLLVIALALALLLAVRMLRRRANQRVISVSAREAQELYQRLESALSARGMGRPAHVTPEAHARALEASGFVAADAVTEVTEVYLQARYGQLQMPRERVRSLKQRISDVKRAA